MMCIQTYTIYIDGNKKTFERVKRGMYMCVYINFLQSL